MRRNFYKLQEKGSPLAGEAVRRIATLYRIEAEIRGKPPDLRQQVRAKRSRPVVEAFRAWLDLQLPRLPGSSKMAEAIRYALNQWDAFIRFPDDGRIDLDTNPIERAIRSVASGRKNSLFAGSDDGADRWAILASLVATAKLNDVDPYAWLRDVLTKMVEGHSVQRLDELLPWMCG